MGIQIYLTIMLALVVFCLWTLIRRLDNRIDELQYLINTLNNWADHHNTLTKILLDNLNKLHNNCEAIKPEVSE